MTRTNRILTSVLALACLATSAEAARSRKASATLVGIEEVPAISTPAGGSFEATLNSAETQLTYTVTYANLRGAVLQSHIHFAQKGVSGGIMVFLCTNLANGPVGTPTCPTTGSPLTVSGTVDSSDVVGPASQGIGATDFAALVKAIKGGTAYANVHTDLFPAGEIRGQIRYQGPKAGQGEDLAP
jgi:hypothetical protein